LLYIKTLVKVGGFIESGSQPLVHGTEESAADNKGEIYEK